MMTKYDGKDTISFRLHAIFLTKFLEFGNKLEEFGRFQIMIFTQKDIPYFEGILHTIKTDIRTKEKRYHGKLDDVLSVKQIKEFIYLINNHRTLRIHIEAYPWQK